MDQFLRKMFLVCAFLALCFHATVARGLACKNCAERSLVGTTNIPSTELFGLYELFNSTNGNDWVWDGAEGHWDFSGDPQPCDPVTPWQGLTCTTANNQYFINRMDLSGYNLTGSIPDSIGNFEFMVYFDLSTNSLNGSIPSALFTNGFLTTVELYSNHLTGTIPNNINTCDEFIVLALENNHLVGSLPEELYTLTFLQSLDVSNNRLTGTISERISALSLNELTLGYNFFRGTIPNSITLLSGLTKLYLNTCNFTGTIPSDIGLLSKMENLLFSYNDLNGTIPDSVGTLDKLQFLMVDNNFLTGSIPPSIFLLPKLQYVYLGTNFLNGTIPDTLGLSNSITILQLFANDLTGTLPDTVSLLTQLNDLSIFNNSLNGTLPASLSVLTELYAFGVHNNDFSGSLPDLSQMTKLRYLQVQFNRLTGTIPSYIVDLTSLVEIFVGNNLMNGTIPELIGNLQSLEYFIIENSFFTGSIPEGMATLPLLKNFIAYNNSLNGTMPQDWTSTKSITDFDVAYTLISGPIPPTLLQASSLVYLYLDNNFLTGSIPNNITELCQIEVIQLNSNQLTGIIPESLFHCRELTQFIVFENQFSQSLPSSSSAWPVLQQLAIEANSITGTLPEYMCAWSQLNLFVVSQNSLEGSIPCPEGDFPLLNTLEVELNSFTGVLPSWHIHNLTQLDLSDNLLSGKVFPWFLNNPRLFTLFLYNNLFSGSIGDSIGSYPIMVEMQLYNNLLTGSIPKALSELSLLTDFLTNNNQLTGSLEGVVNVTSQPLISRFDVSDNQLTGTIPSALFAGKNLQVFGAAVNCLEGSIPDNVCNCHRLTGLTLDGVRTATQCQHRFFPYSSTHNAYYLNDALTGSIPSCLFTLPALTTLHLSGNGIGGTIPDDVTVTPTLTDLSLSHNTLTGTIPSQLQERVWSSLDLSYNRLNGVLQPSFAQQSDNSSVSLEVNRLSGSIPAAIQDAAVIDVLDGNLFSCNYRRTDLPANDENEDIYECGSNSLDAALYLYAAVLFCIVALLAALTFSCGKPRLVYEWLETFRKEATLATLAESLESIRRFFASMTLLALLVLMPAYIALSHYYSTYSKAYIWVTTAAFMSGFTPAVVLLVLWIAFSAVILVVGYFLMGSISRVEKQATSSEAEEQTSSQTATGRPRLVLEALVTVVLLLINALIVTSVNVAYVYVNHNASSVEVVAMQFFVVLFKLWWNGSVVTAVLRKLNAALFQTPVYRTSMVVLLSRIVLFNNLVAPFIATAFISSNCFYNIIETPASVSTTFSVTNCVITESSDDGPTVCVGYSTATSYSTYTPPFIYNYQCASTFISAYSDVYVYMFVVVAFAMPLFQLMYNQWLQKSKLKGLCFEGLQKLQWTLLRDFKVSENNNADDVKLTQTKFEFFRAKIATAELVSALGILLTFGVIFPPLSVVILTAIYVQTYGYEVLMGRLLAFYKHEPLVAAELYSNSAPLLMLFRECVWVVVPVVTVFYAYLLFDTLGDEVGWRKAMWMPFTVLVLPLLGWMGVASWSRWRNNGKGDKATHKAGDDML